MIGGRESGPSPEAVVATVVFIDAVRSTELAAALGDSGWGELLEQYRSTVRRELAAHGGREVDATGDGFLASFEAPARALACATAVAASVGELGMQVRIGVHTGQCEVVAGRLGGIALHIGARIAAAAEPGEVLVSSTVRELLAGSGHRFSDRGVRDLRGVPGEWRLFTVATGDPRIEQELLGREAEQARLDGLVTSARGGRSGCLVVRGEVGMGKSSLLRYALERAHGMTVLSARGVESEAELPFATLNDLVRPILGKLAAIPEAQRGALAGALALEPPVTLDPFAICAATLSLLAAAAEEARVLAIVDDAQWLDASSCQALLFSARRLDAEGIALVLAVREGEGEALRASGLPELILSGLAPDVAAALLDRRLERPVDPEVARRLARATGGNPLALLEVPTLLTDSQLAGAQPLPDPLPAAPAVRDAFQRRIAALPVRAQRALLVVSASETGSLDEVTAALERLEIDPAGLGDAEEAGLLAVAGDRLELLHPLLRSVVYHGAPAAARRSAHEALADVARNGAPDRRAWHLAAATPAPDAGVAAALEEAAASARRRGGHAEAASAFERAARLTADEEECARRLLEAADDSRLAGRSDHAVQLLAEAVGRTSDPLLRARIQHLRGAVEMWRGAPGDARDLLRDEAERIAELDAGKAARMLTDAAWACLMAGNIDIGLEAAERACELASRRGGVTELLAGGVLGIALLVDGQSRRAIPLLEKSEPLFEERAPARPRQLIHPGGQVLTWVEEYAKARRALTSLAEAARARGALAALPYTLAALSELDFRTGNWVAAYADATEAVELARATQQLGTLAFSLACLARIEAAQGREEDCRAHVGEALQLTSFGAGAVIAYAAATLGLLELGLGRSREAIGHLEQVAGEARLHGLAEPGVVQWAPDLIEAYLRTGRVDDARAELERFEHQARESERMWALAAAARCRGLLAGDDFEAAFLEAMRYHKSSATPFERARTELAFGERLRRGRRRSDSREWLRRSLATFERLGAAPWAERARTELRASGETARRGDPSAAEQLTPQELQVALVVARGATNKEAGDALFLSAKTIEAHLGRVYRKLDIRSRTELAARLAREGALAGAA